MPVGPPTCKRDSRLWGATSNPGHLFAFVDPIIRLSPLSSKLFCARIPNPKRKSPKYESGFAREVNPGGRNDSAKKLYGTSKAAAVFQGGGQHRLASGLRFRV